MVDEPDSNRWPTACAAARPLSFRPLALPRLASPGMRHGSAARTGRARRQPRTRTAVECPSLQRIGASRRQSRCDLHPWHRPRRSTQTQRTAPYSTMPPPRACRHGCFRANGSRETFACPLRTPKRKRPRAGDPRAFTFLGRSGDRPPACRRSVDGSRFVAARQQRRRERARTVAGGPQRGLLRDGEVDVHGLHVIRGGSWLARDGAPHVEGRARYARAFAATRPFVGETGTRHRARGDGTPRATVSIRRRGAALGAGCMPTTSCRRGATGAPLRFARACARADNRGAPIRHCDGSSNRSPP